MVSRRELLRRIEINLREIRGQRKQVGTSITGLRGQVSELKPVQREELPQRRFGAPVQQVKERQQVVLRRRQQARVGIAEREREIERLGKLEAGLVKQITSLERRKEFLEDLPRLEKKRREDIEAGILIPRGTETITVREVPPQQLGAIITRDEVPPTRLERSERFLQNITRFLAEKVDPQKREDRIFFEELNKRRFQTSETFNKDVDEFNRKFSGRELGEQEFTRAEKRKASLETRASDIEKNEAAALKAISDIERREERKRFRPERIGVGFATGVFTAIPATALLGIGLVTKPIQTVTATAIGLKEAAITRPFETVGEVIGGALVLETAFRGVKAPFKKFFIEPVKIFTKRLVTPFRSAEVIRAVSPDIAAAQFRITGITPKQTAIVQTRFDVAVGKLLRGFTAEQGSLSRVLRRRQTVIELAPEFRTEIISGEFLIRRGKIISDAATLTIRQRGKISIQRLRGEVEARRVTLSDISKFDPAFKKALQAIAERTAEVPVAEAAVPRVLGKLGKPATVEVGRVVTKDILKTTRKALKDLEFETIPDGRTLRRARIAFTTKELKPQGLKVAENVEFFETVTALEDVTFPRLRAPKPEAIQTIRGITKFIDIPEQARLKVVRLGGEPLKKLGLQKRLKTIAATKLVQAAAIPKPARGISRAKVITKAEAAIAKSPAVQRARQLSRTRFAAQTKQATPEKSLALSKESMRLTARQVPRLSEKLITKELTKQLPKLTTKLVSKQIPKLSTKLAQKLVTKLVPKLTTKLVSKAVTKPVVRPAKIPAKTIIKPIILPRGEPLPKPRKKRKKEFDESLLLAPDITSRAARLKIVIPRSQVRQIAKELKTGLGLAKIPVIK